MAASATGSTTSRSRDYQSWLDPIAHIWVSRTQPWIRIPDGVLAFAEQPEDERELARAWRRRHAAPS